jgi:hypothetical protein
MRQRIEGAIIKPIMKTKERFGLGIPVSQRPNGVGMKPVNFCKEAFNSGRMKYDGQIN